MISSKLQISKLLSLLQSRSSSSSTTNANSSLLLQRWIDGGWISTLPVTTASITTALSWARRRSPIPISNKDLQILFRKQRVRVWDPHTDQIKRVKPAAVLCSDARLLLLPSTPLTTTTTEDNTTKKVDKKYTKLDTTAHRNALQLIRSSILKDDPLFLAVNKPAGLPVQGGTHIHLSIDDLLPSLNSLAKDNTNASVSHLDALKLVHRLDKQVTGVLLIAKGADAAALLSKAFSHSINSKADDVYIEKKYWALVVIDSLHSPLLKTAHNNKNAVNKEFVIEEKIDSKYALTKYKMMSIDQKENRNKNKNTTNAIGSLKWLELSPITGRKHQLRIHCSSHLGASIVGDSRYGVVRDEPQKSVLHCLKKQYSHDNENNNDENNNNNAYFSGFPPLMLHCREIKIYGIRPEKKGRKESVCIQAPVPTIWKSFFRAQGLSFPPESF